MKMIDEKEIKWMDKVKSDIEIYGIPQVYANIYSEGFNAAEKQLKPLFVEFEKFCQKTRNIDHVIAMDEQMATGHVQSIRHRTTEELFELWLKEQTKTTTNKYRGMQKEEMNFDGGELAKEHWNQTKK